MGQMNAQDEFGRNCVFHALMCGTPQILQTCLDRGANPNTIDVCGNTPLSWLLTHFLGCQTYEDRYNTMSSLDILLQYGADPNLHASGHMSPLMIATLSNNPILVSHLISNGASVNNRLQDSELGLLHKGASALSLATSESLTDIIPFLKVNAEPEIIFHALQKTTDPHIREMFLPFRSINAEIQT